jgi:hypothetical protein
LTVAEFITLLQAPMRNRAGNFSVGRLMEFLTALGQDIKITAKPTRKEQGGNGSNGRMKGRSFGRVSEMYSARRSQFIVQDTLGVWRDSVSSFDIAILEIYRWALLRTRFRWAFCE